MNDSTRSPHELSGAHARAAIGVALVVSVEAFPLVVAVIGAAMWTANVHVNPPAHLPAISIHAYIDQVVVVLVLPPAYFVAGAGWCLAKRLNVGLTVFFLHAATALLTMFYGVQLVFGAGDFGGPGPHPPIREFFLWLAISLTISAVSAVWLAVAELTRYDTQRSAPPTTSNAPSR